MIRSITQLGVFLESVREEAQKLPTESGRIGLMLGLPIVLARLATAHADNNADAFRVASVLLGVMAAHLHQDVQVNSDPDCPCPECEDERREKEFFAMRELINDAANTDKNQWPLFYARRSPVDKTEVIISIVAPQVVGADWIKIRAKDYATAKQIAEKYL